MRIIVLLLFATSVSYACGSASAPKPAKLASAKVLSGFSQSGKVGTALASPIVIQALDSSGHPIAGLNMIYGPSDGGTVNPTNPITDATGKASVTWTLGSHPGPDTLLFSVAQNTLLVQGAVYATANP